ncbi:hippurate hydrolase [Gonapodya prolifera JEL478]|uniref:Hippurate hydrolase n=1 Tax=Gonapodya prolifera (strain JEL478) TaxID=1344416 RepID=A0A139A7R1_GONPJ|nr:hippurate hydrolase [Gonapodya prolifera JEL478]|eukprot:KXS12832.1 hippurate hydrolase [Gonapodya prolifera JEL478]
MASPKIHPEFKRIFSDMVTARRMLHAWPELGFEEVKTSSYVAEELRALPGISVHRGLAKTGVVGIYRGRTASPTIAFRADMDGLPVNERPSHFRDASWVSKNPGVSHACGHDGHIVMLLFFAKVLVHLYPPSTFDGTLVFVFQPAEEGGGGAEKMLADNLLSVGDIKDIDAFYGIHLMSGVPLGKLAIKSGPIMAGIDTFDIHVQGVGGHGAMPHQTVDSILVATALVQQLHHIVSRNTDPMEAAVLTVGKINAGTAVNVIADSAEINGTIRHFNAAVQSVLHDRIKTLCAGVAKAYDCTIEAKVDPEYPPTINHEKETEIVVRSVKKVLGEDGILRMQKGVMGSEDFSYFLNVRPGAFMFVGAAVSDKDINKYPHHSPIFEFHEDALLIGASIWLQLFEDIFIQPSVRSGLTAMGTGSRL